MEIKKTLTAAPKARQRDADLVFGQTFTDHMFMADYTAGQGWHDPQILPYGPLAMDPANMTLHYGQAVFEGLKCYRAEDGRLLLFRPEDNFKRLNRSDERMCIPHIDVDFAMEALVELLKVDQDWIPRSDGTSLYIRPFTFAAEAALGVHPAHSYKFMIILSPVGLYYPEGLNPVKIAIEDELVRAVRGGVGFTKAAANYAISLKGQEKALEEGYTQVLWLDGVERRYIEEVGAMNVMFKINGEIVTPELGGSILPGITRDSSIQLLRSWGLKVNERRVSIDELIADSQSGALEEAFGTGTAAVISPIGEFYWEGKPLKVGDGATGPISRRLYDELTGIQYGRLPDPFGWVKEVK